MSISKILFNLAAMFSGGLIVFFMSQDLDKAAFRKAWPTVEGKILISKKVTTYPGLLDTSTKPLRTISLTLLYEYAVEGKKYYSS